MTINHDIDATVADLVKDYNDQATREAALRADTFLDMGQTDRQRFWLTVREAIRSMRERDTPG